MTIFVGSPDNKYTLPKALLFLRSSYFEAMFKGGVKEGVEQTAILELIDGVVSVRAFESLVLWICVGRIILQEPAPEESITAAVELSRFTDMCGVTGMQQQVAGQIKEIILSSPAQISNRIPRNPDRNTQNITPAHLVAASNLPRGHAVCEILAMAAVEGYMQRDTHKFTEECHYLPGFSADLLTEVKKTLVTINSGGFAVEFKDPLSQDMVTLHGSVPEEIEDVW